MTRNERHTVEGIKQALRDAPDVWERIAIQNDPTYAPFSLRAIAVTELAREDARAAA